MASNYSRTPGKLTLICNNPACNAPIKNHLWLFKGVYCGPWCERNFGKNPNKDFFKKKG